MKPDYLSFKKLAQSHSLVPTWMEIPADLETPVTVYLKLAGSRPYGLLLESVEGGERFGRYSFISARHHLKFEVAEGRVRMTGNPLLSRIGGESRNGRDPLNSLKTILAELAPVAVPELPRFCGGAVGMVGYDMVRNFEELPSILKDDLGIPDALFLFTDECVVFDHWRHTMLLIKWNLIEGKSPSAVRHVYRKAESALWGMVRRIRNCRVTQEFIHGSRDHGRSRVEDLRSNLKVGEYCEGVRRIKEYIRAGDAIQVVLSQRFEVSSAVSPFKVYRALRMINPSPYLYYLNLGGFLMAGSSPEILVRKEGNRCIVRPIAGTRRRGLNSQEDLRLEAELLRDPKERAEHLMLVDLGRNDLGRCCISGSVTVKDLMSVERYSHVMHLVSTVEGNLKRGEDSFSLFKACFPAGTVTGAPKIRAMQIIEELEKRRRKTYAGSVGYFSYSGDMDMAITIRTLLFLNHRIYMQAGAGIVADSVPHREDRESRSKAAVLLNAVRMAESGILTR